MLSDLQGLRIIPRKRTAKGGSGIHLENGRGVSLDFSGHSPYIAGDDIGKIDWKAYARTKSLYVKDFAEERQINISVLLDCSSSMDYGSPDKWQFASILALCLSYIALHQGDRLSLLAVNDRLEVVKHNAAGMDNFYDLINLLPQVIPGGTNDPKAFSEALGCASGITFIISDFLNLAAEKMLDYLLLQGKQAVVMHVLSPDELWPSCEGELKLVDAETGRIKRIQLNMAARRRYIARMQGFWEKVRETCVQKDAGYVLARTDMKAYTVLRQALEVC